ncbi:MAG: NUMOD4 motif-containing HNH endonuclease [Bacteroidales bacterium]|nr:NUMOD4 motif-containing HNH endonuclease [Bacteroidales bacterium]
MKQREIWKDIQGYDGKYQVSNQGNVRSKRRDGWRLLKQGIGDGRYCQVHLGGNHTPRVHRLVAEAFLDNPDNKPQIDHIDGNPYNNAVSNLRYVSPSQNAANPNTRGRNRGSREEQRKNKMRRIMVQRLERMRQTKRDYVGEDYQVIYDCVRDCYILSFKTDKTFEVNGWLYKIDRRDDLPSTFYTDEYLNADGTIDYAEIWKDMERELNGEVWDEDDDHLIAINEDGEDEIVWLDEG